MLFLLSCGFWSVLGIATRLEPDARGHGTHVQLGLAPCSFLRMTGRPCPTCGMTTAFAWMTRGRLDRAWMANPAGGLLAIATPPLACWLMLCAWRGRPLGFTTVGSPLAGFFVIAAALTAATWFFRLLPKGS